MKNRELQVEFLQNKSDFNIIVILKVLGLPVEMFRGKSSNSLLHELIWLQIQFHSDEILYSCDKLACPSDGTINMASEKEGI